MTQEEVSRAMRKQLGKTISQSYLSQIESGSRPHLTNTTRTLLAKFFGVYPGFLVNDPEGYHTELISDLRVREATLDSWLQTGAERFKSDPELSATLLAVSEAEDSRRTLLLLRRSSQSRADGTPRRRAASGKAEPPGLVVGAIVYGRKHFLLAYVKKGGRMSWQAF